MTRVWLLALVVISSLAAAADYTIVRRTTIDAGTPHEQTEYWGPGRLVVDDGAQRTIVDFRKQQVTGIDRDERTYWTMPLDRIVRQLVAIGAAVEALPEPARDMLGLARTVSLSPMGNTSNIAGRDAKEYGIGGDGVRGVVWLAEDLDPAAILGDDAAMWWRAGGPLRGVGPLGDVTRAIAEQKIRGMPVWLSLTTTSERRSTTVESRVVGVREEAAPADVDRLPAGFRREDPPLPAE